MSRTHKTQDTNQTTSKTSSDLPTTGTKHSKIISNLDLKVESNISSVDQITKELRDTGKGQDQSIMSKIFEVEQAIQALTARSGGKLDSAKDFVTTTKDVITYLGGGSWPQERFIIYKNARLCLEEDIEYIQAKEELTTFDVNNPKESEQWSKVQDLGNR